MTGGVGSVSQNRHSLPTDDDDDDDYDDSDVSDVSDYDNYDMKA